MTTTNNTDFTYWDSGSLQPDLPYNINLLVLDALLNLSPEDKDLTTPPTTSGTDIGKTWIIAASATGRWSGKDDQVAICSGINVDEYREPQEGWIAYVRDEDATYVYDGSAWALLSSSGGSIPYDIIVALGDESTAITTGTAKVTIRAPRAMTLTSVSASLTTASSSGLPQFDVNKNGTTIFSTKPTIDVSEKTTATAATPSVLSVTAIAADDELTFDIVTAGTGAAGAKVVLKATI